MGWVRAAVAVIPLTLILLISVPPDFILGRGPYWDYLISDRAQAVTGYLYFVQNSWAQPLLFIPNLSIPQGDYLINADSIVLLALIGRVIHSLLGATMIPYGVWYVLCGVLNGVAGVVILRRTGVADFGRLAAAAVIVGSTPFWLERWYHFSLIAQFLILLSVHAYLIARARPWVGLAYGLVLAVLAGLIHIYLFCMIMLILAGIIVEVGLRRDGWRLSRILSGVAALMLAAVSVYAQGYFSLSGSTENQGYMEFSTNLLSPFYSTHSGFSAASWSLLAEMREKADAWPFFLGQRPDATGGQYLEGMSYLGLGVWLLVAVAIVRTGPREILALARRHYVLIAAAVVALAFAVTPLVTFGSAHLQVFDPGSKLVSVLSSLRASGRFFWVTGYIAIQPHSSSSAAGSALAPECCCSALLLWSSSSTHCRSGWRFRSMRAGVPRFSAANTGKPGLRRHRNCRSFRPPNVAIRTRRTSNRSSRSLRRRPGRCRPTARASRGR